MKWFDELLNNKRYRGFSIFGNNKWTSIGVISASQEKEIIDYLNGLKEKEIKKYLWKDSSSLSVIKNQTEELCKTAIHLDPVAIRYIHSPKTSYWEHSLKENPYLIEYLREQTVDLCILALENEKISDPFRLVYKFVKIVPNPYHETTLKNLYEKKAILDALK